MSTLFELLDTLAASASELPWELGSERYGALVTRGECRNAALDERAVAEYGGRVIGESIARPDSEFIAALASAWPQIRAALVAGKALADAHEAWAQTVSQGGSNAHLLAIAQQEAAHVAVASALALLFGEQAPAVRGV